jgi:hypothetical protein
MAELCYTVSATLPDAKLAQTWLSWLRDQHIAEVLAGGATGAEVVQMDGTPYTYEVRYRFPSREVFQRYEQEHAPRLRAEGLALFPIEKGVVYRRSLGESLMVFTTG